MWKQDRGLVKKMRDGIISLPLASHKHRYVSFWMWMTKLSVSMDFQIFKHIVEQ